MANNFRLSNAGASASADATCALVNGGYARFYDGTIPTNTDDAITTQSLLAECIYGSPAFGAAVNGVATANPITGDPSANNTGTASWFRAYKADGVTPVFQGTVGLSGCDCNISDVSIVTGAPVDIVSMTYTQPKH